MSCEPIKKLLLSRHKDKEEMEEGAVRDFSEKLENLSEYKPKQLDVSNSQIDAKGLLKDLKGFKTFLSKSAEKRITDSSLQKIAKDIRDLVEKADDVLDRLIVQTINDKSKNIIKKTFSRNVDHSVKFGQLAEEFKTITKSIPENLDLKDLPGAAPEKVTTSELKQDYVVEFDEAAETLIERLTNDKNKNLDIITITGMPGLGKTTLAKKIFNNPVINKAFRCAWVYVSKKYSKMRVYIDILSFFKRDIDYTCETDETITKALHNSFEELTKPYFIVMDEVWSSKDWEDLESIFPKNSKGSRILITSIDKTVCPDSVNHELKFLTVSESWELLENKVFGKGKCPPGEFQTLGEYIAAKCEGLPLAIDVVAGILKTHRASSDKWKEVAHNVSSAIVSEMQFMNVISVIYNHLPYTLKSCFLYLGVFPEEYEIPVWNLIYLWIAEGFIEHDGNLSLEQIAETCLEDLVNRNLLMVSKWKPNGKIKTCHVHDMLHDFCKKEAANQNFFHEIKETETEVTRENYRRVSVHPKVLKYISSKPPGQRVRSFLCFQPDETEVPKELITAIPKAFELLRVLDIKTIVFIMFPKELLQLALLRYLAFYCDVKVVPKNISQLFNMQTLIFYTTSLTLEFKEEIWKMYHLRHLITNSSALLPTPLSSAEDDKKDVQSLSMISPESCTAEVLKRTPNIIKLGVRGKVGLLFDKLFDNVAKLEHLTNLKLYNDSSERTVPRLPNKFPTMLKKLTLSEMLLDSEQMEILKTLEDLEVLKLKNITFKGETWEVKDKGFVSLMLLYIEKTNLKTWKASANYFQKLKRLVLKHCEYLQEVPSTFAEITSFQILELYRTTSEAAQSARRIQSKKREILKATSGVFKLSIYPPDMF